MPLATLKKASPHTLHPTPHTLFQVSPDAKLGTAKHENILIDELALFQPLFSRQKAAFIYYPHFPLDNSHFPLANTKSGY
ncbi:MAG: hypothetical protein ACKPH4_04275 [Microcystis panniformis]